MATPSEAVPTRVGPGLKASVAHGPPKEWDRVGMNVTVSVTLPAAQVRHARAKGYVLSRVLKESLDRLLGGETLVRTREELERAREHVRMLETYEASLLEKGRKENDARLQENAREAAIRLLATEFSQSTVRTGLVEVHRPSLGRATVNVRWLEERVAKHPLLRSMKVEQVLDLLIAASAGSERPDRERGEAP